MLTEETKKNLLKLLIKKIADISDKKYQERVWIRGEGPECDDFTETVCKFFDDANADLILEKYKEFGITKEQYRPLKMFRDEFREFSDNNNWPSKFIDTPEWAEIMEKAKEVLKAFNYMHIPYSSGPKKLDG